MVFGLNKDDEEQQNDAAVAVGDNSAAPADEGDQAQDAADELKKMQEKEDSGDCAFC